MVEPVVGATDQASEAPEQTAAEPPAVNLTKISPVAVASVWPKEAAHFTPWLLQNAELLSEILGVDVELVDREHPVGKFSLDIIGREVATGHPVIIENQYGQTDHGHLGQIMTYAGGTNPAIIVWIAESFREEHRAALDWLNEHTDNDVRFFGIRLSAITLDGAPAGLVAPWLEIVVKPNEWQRQAKAAASGASGGTLTPAQTMYKEYWSSFELEAKKRHWTNASPPAQNWWSMPSGVTGVVWTVSFAKFGCRSEIYFEHPDPEVNLARWKVLEAQQDLIQAKFGEGTLIFDELPNNKGCRIEARLDGPKIGQTDGWPEALAWMLVTQERLRSAVELAGGVPSSLSVAGSPSAGTTQQPPL